MRYKRKGKREPPDEPRAEPIGNDLALRGLAKIKKLGLGAGSDQRPTNIETRSRPSEATVFPSSKVEEARKTSDIAAPDPETKLPDAHKFYVDSRVSQEISTFKDKIYSDISNAQRNIILAFIGTVVTIAFALLLFHFQTVDKIRDEYRKDFVNIRQVLNEEINKMLPDIIDKLKATRETPDKDKQKQQSALGEDKKPVANKE